MIKINIGTFDNPLWVDIAFGAGGGDLPPIHVGDALKVVRVREDELGYELGQPFSGNYAELDADNVFTGSNTFADIIASSIHLENGLELSDSHIFYGTRGSYNFLDNVIGDVIVDSLLPEYNVTIPSGATVNHLRNFRQLRKGTTDQYDYYNLEVDLSAYRTAAQQDVIDDEIRAMIRGVVSIYAIEGSNNPNFLSDADDIMVESITDVDGNVLTYEDLKVGDEVRLKDVGYPERWVSAIDADKQLVTFTAFEGKIDLTNYYTKTQSEAIFQHIINSGNKLPFEFISGLPNTLAGYGITDAYTKLEVDTNISLVQSELDKHKDDITLHPTQAEKDYWNAKQEELHSGVNIKSINNNSILGSGNLNINELPPVPSADKEYTLKAIGGVPTWVAAADWWEDTAYLNSLTVSDVGTIKTVPINGKEHRVRLIGVDHDDLATGGKAHTTWEFMDIISDNEGYSYGIVWNDAAETTGSNYDYTNSSIRKALNGTGNATKFLWARKGQTTFDSESRTVLQMLPTSLQNAIKTVKKQVNVNSGGTWGLVEFTDKLFLLATKEMGYSSSYAEDLTTYKFYEGHTESTDAIRIKKQINGTEVLTSSTDIPSGSGQDYQGTVYNYAGYNYKADDTGGGWYWTRSPRVSYSDAAWSVSGDGYLNLDYAVCGNANGVAPAFCL